MIIYLLFLFNILFPKSEPLNLSHITVGDKKLYSIHFENELFTSSDNISLYQINSRGAPVLLHKLMVMDGKIFAILKNSNHSRLSNMQFEFKAKPGEKIKIVIVNEHHSKSAYTTLIPYPIEKG